MNLDDKRGQKSAVEIFRQFMDREVNDPEVQRYKTEWIQQYSQTERLPVFEWASIASAAALALLFGILFSLQPFEVVPQPVPAPVPVPRQAEPIPLPPKPSIRAPHVEVKSASSEVGTVMIYQKTYHHAPYAIVWVFTGGQQS